MSYRAVFTVFLLAFLASPAAGLLEAPASDIGDPPRIVLDQSTAEIFPQTWRSEPISARAEPLDAKQHQRCREIVDRAFAKYPKTLLHKNLKAIYGLGRLEYSGVATGGTNSRSSVYFVGKSNYSSSAIEGIIHAEFSSILLRNFQNQFSNDVWCQCNPSDFHYRGSGVQSIKNKQAALQPDERLHQDGFINEYGKSSIEEDFNSHASRLFMGDSEYWQAVEQHLPLKQKSELMVAFFQKLDPSLNRQYFLSLTKSFLPTEFLPPAPDWSGASESLIVSPDHPWVTPAERTGMIDSPDYVTTISWLEKLASASPMIRCTEFGKTPQGRSLIAVIASREGIADIAGLVPSGKPTVMVQAGIHSGEIDGKDAGMMLLRDIAFGGKADLLDRANLLFVPVLNADGHERSSIWNRPNQRGPMHMGWRTTAQNLNLNRDYMKAQAPEMIAVLRLINDAKPALYLDVHVTDGVDYQYDITYGFHGWDDTFAWSPTIGRWLDRTLRPKLDRDLNNAGHIPGPLVFARNKRDLSQGIVAKPYDPRFSTGYGDLRHLPTLLIETHSLKPFRQRVLGTYVLIESCLRAVSENAITLNQAIEKDTLARPPTLGFNWNQSTDHQTSMAFKGIASEGYDSFASGTKEVQWLAKPVLLEGFPVHQLTTPGITLRRPKAYYVPTTELDMIEVLKSHGVHMEALTGPVDLEVEQYRFVEPQSAPVPFEGRHTLSTKIQTEQSRQTIPAGTMKILTDQALGDLAIGLLEPLHLDSLAAWGFVPEILQRTEYIEGYVIAPMAEKMMTTDPKLKEEFEAKLSADPEFAKDPEARLQWFYERSPYYDQAYLRYPVFVER